MQAIEIKNLSFIYSKGTPFEQKALDDINLSVAEGELVGVVGATGSGKSTLIQHLNGLIRVQDKKRASIVVDGMDTSSKKTLRKLRFTVGMVFQYPEYQLFADTVEKDVAFGPKNMKLGAEEINARVRRALDVVGLDYDTFATRSPFDLSGGEKRRVAIAGVIAMQPRILVLDEPVAGLDPAGRAEILDLIGKLKREVSPTVIIVSHSMDDMAQIADPRQDSRRRLPPRGFRQAGACRGGGTGAAHRYARCGQTYRARRARKARRHHHGGAGGRAGAPQGRKGGGQCLGTSPSVSTIPLIPRCIALTRASSCC